MSIALAAVLGAIPGRGLLPPSGPPAPCAAAPAPSPAEQQDWAALIGPPPAEGSPQDAQDLATLLRLQATRTADDVDRILGEGSLGGASPTRWGTVSTRAGAPSRSTSWPRPAGTSRPWWRS